MLFTLLCGAHKRKFPFKWLLIECVCCCDEIRLRFLFHWNCTLAVRSCHLQNKTPLSETHLSHRWYAAASTIQRYIMYIKIANRIIFVCALSRIESIVCNTWHTRHRYGNAIAKCLSSNAICVQPFGMHVVQKFYGAANRSILTSPGKSVYTVKNATPWNYWICLNLLASLFVCMQSQSHQICHLTSRSGTPNKNCDRIFFSTKFYYHFCWIQTRRDFAIVWMDYLRTVWNTIAIFLEIKYDNNVAWILCTLFLFSAIPAVWITNHCAVKSIFQRASRKTENYLFEMIFLFIFSLLLAFWCNEWEMKAFLSST